MSMVFDTTYHGLLCYQMWWITRTVQKEQVFSIFKMTAAGFLKCTLLSVAHNLTNVSLKLRHVELVQYLNGWLPNKTGKTMSNFGENQLNITKLIVEFRNSRWRPPPFSISFHIIYVAINDIIKNTYQFQLNWI